MSDRNHWTALRQRKISRRTMLGASAKAALEQPASRWSAAATTTSPTRAL